MCSEVQAELCVYCLVAGDELTLSVLMQPEMTLGNIARKQQKSACDNRSTLTLKLMGRVIRSPKQRAPVAQQNGPRSNKNFKQVR